MDDENKKKIMDTLDSTKQQMEVLTDLITDIVDGQSQAPGTSTSTSPRRSEDPRIFSNDNLGNYTKHMTISTVKLFGTKGIEVLRIEDSVGLYFIVPNQPVRTAARSAHLRIVRIQPKFQDDDHPPAFLQVGDWVYPLLQGSMVYKSADNYYLFPDLVSSTSGSSVGVILPKSVGPEERRQFERLLLYFSEMEDFPDKAPAEFGNSTDAILKARTSLELVKSDSGSVYSQRSGQIRGGGAGGSCRSSKRYGWRIGQGIQAGGELVGNGLKIGARGTAQAIGLGAMALKGVMAKEERDAVIPCAVERTVGLAKDVTDRVADISGQVWEKVMQITVKFTGLTACYIRAQTEPMLRRWLEATGISQEALDEMEREARDLGDGLRGTFWEVYGGPETASKVLADAVGRNTVEVVTHCYGPSAAKILCSAGEAVTNVAVGGNTVRQVTDVRGMVKKTVKRAGWDICTAECSQREMDKNKNALKISNLKPDFIKK